MKILILVLNFIFKIVNSIAGTQEPSDTTVNISANDMCALNDWPSHVRRNRAQILNGISLENICVLNFFNLKMSTSILVCFGL